MKDYNFFVLIFIAIFNLLPIGICPFQFPIRSNATNGHHQIDSTNFAADNYDVVNDHIYVPIVNSSNGNNSSKTILQRPFYNGLEIMPNETENEAFLRVFAVEYPDEIGQLLEELNNKSAAAERKAMWQERKRQRKELHRQQEAKRHPTIIFGEDSNGEDDSSKEDTMDYLTGEVLGKEEAKIRPLIRTGSDGLIKFQAWIDGEINVPVRVHFYNFDEEECKRGNGQRIFQLLICKTPIQGKCEKGILICFPSKLDPDNSHESLNPQFSIENIEGNELATSCNGEEMKKHWNGILGVQKVFHAIQLRTIDEGKIELTTSFHEKKEIMSPFKHDGCIAIDIGTEEEELILSFIDVEENELSETIIPRQSQAELIEQLANGATLADQELISIVPLNIFADFKQNSTAPLFGFAVANGEEKCEMGVTLRGENLQRCLDQNCTKFWSADDDDYTDEKQMAYYKKDFARMKTINKLTDIPEYYKRAVGVYNVGGRPRAYLKTRWDLPFAILTESEEQPPNITIVIPKNIGYCAFLDEFEKNEFLLAYNGRPDCYWIFGWGLMKLRMYDDKFPQYSVEIPTNKDAILQFRDGGDGQEFVTMDQFGEEHMLGSTTFSRCSMDMKAEDIGEYGDGKRNKMWKFILNPKRGTPFYLESPECDLKISFWLDEVSLMLTANEKNSVDG